MASLVSRLVRNVSRINLESLIGVLSDVHYYKGGFEKKMTRREAAMILGISPSSSADRVSRVHRRLMLINHPDRGGSQLIAIKVNEAKDVLIKNKY